MTVAVITLAAALALAIGCIIALAVMLRSSLASERASMAVEGIASRQQLTAERERDTAVAARVQVTAERDAALIQLAATQKLANAAGEEFTRRVQAHLDSGNAADASRFLDELLGSPLPGVAVAAPVAAPGGHGDTGAPAVPAAAVAAAGDAGRRP